MMRAKALRGGDVVSGVFRCWQMALCPPEASSGLSGQAHSDRAQPNLRSPNAHLSFFQGALEIVCEPACVGSSLLFPGATEKQPWKHGPFAFHASPMTLGVRLLASVFVGNGRLAGQSGPVGP